MLLASQLVIIERILSSIFPARLSVCLSEDRIRAEIVSKGRQARARARALEEERREVEEVIDLGSEDTGSSDWKRARMS